MGKGKQAVEKAIETLNAGGFELQEPDGNGEFETVDTGDFVAVKMQSPGDTFIGRLLLDCENNRPDWLPEAFEDKVYAGVDMEGQRIIISKFHKLQKVVLMKGLGEKVIYRVVRGEKSGTENNAYVNFLIATKTA